LSDRHEIPPWDEKLREIGDALINHPTRTQWGNILVFLHDYLGPTATVAVHDGHVVASHGHPSRNLAERCEEPALLLSSIALDQGSAVRVDDTRTGPFSPPSEGERLHASGYTAALAIPLIHRGLPHGSLVLWFAEELGAHIDPQQLPANYILSALRQLLTLSYERDNRPMAAEGALSSLGEVNRLASKGLLLDSSLEALRGPSSSILIQIDELKRLTDDIHAFADSADTCMSDALGEMSQAIEDITLAATLLRRELANMSDLSSSEEGREPIQLSRLVHEAAVIARPELEQRGFLLKESTLREAYIQGEHHELLQLTLGLLFAWNQDDRPLESRPILEIQLDGEGSESQLRVLSLSPSSHAPPQPTAACLRIAQSYGGRISTDNLAITVRLPTLSDLPIEGGTAKELAQTKKVLIIDDDPLFTRALRRALSPHEVRVCASAADAELALMTPDYTPDLVICDLWLPGTNGRALHEHISKQYPQVASHFVFVSGAPLSNRDILYFRDVSCKTLSKPIQVAAILSILDQVS